MVVKKLSHKNAYSQKDLKGIVLSIKKKVKKGDVIVVMGAGESFKWSREILKKI